MSKLSDDFFAVPVDQNIKPADPAKFPGFYVREMSSLARDIWEVKLQKSVTNEDSGLRSALIIACVCNEDGTPVFTDKDQAKLDALPISRTRDLASICHKHNKLDDEASDEIEEK